MKKAYIFLLLSSTLSFGQSVIISPTNASQTKISKFGGTAKLEIEGTGAFGGEIGPTGNSEISLSNMAPLGYSSTSSIKFNDIYSIKNTYTPNLGGSVENNFGFFYNTIPFLAFNPNSLTLETLPLGVSHSVPNLLSLSNTNTLATDVKSEMYFKTGTIFTGSIKTIGNSTNSARLSFFTGSALNSSSLLERISILDNGKVGIGTNTVSANDLLEVNGRVRLRRASFASGLWLNNSANGTAITDGAFVGLNNESPGTETAGFWLNGAFRWHVDRAGNTLQNSMTATNLAGTGMRNVYTDANGTLTTSSQTKYLSIHPSKFIPSSGSDFAKISYIYDKLGFNPSTQGSVFASVELPHGARVTSIKFYFIDNSPTDDLLFNLFSNNLVNINGGSLILDFQSPLPNNNTYRSGTIDLNSPLIIDNQNYSYFISIEPRTQSSNSLGTWQPITMRAASVVITYNE